MTRSLAALAGFLFLTGASAEEQPPDAVPRARAASVEILVDGRLDGSGWIADAKGSVVTAAHVVWNPHRKLEVVSPTLGRHPAKVVATHPGHDLARLVIDFGEAIPEKLPFLELAKEIPAEGEAVLLFGSAVFRHGLTVRGSVARRELGYEYFDTLGCYGGFYFVAAPSPPGTSGGCWLDLQGRVVGNQSGFINSQPGVGAGIALVAPLAAITRILTENGDQSVATLGCGLEELWSQHPDFIRRLPEGTSGVVTVPVRKGGPVERAGLHSEHVIVSLFGKPALYRSELMKEIRSRKPGETVTLQVVAPGEEVREVEIVLGSVSRKKPD